MSIIEKLQIILEEKKKDEKEVKDAMREIKKLQTGFGIRRGARIDADFFGNKKKGKKGKKGMSDKQLMRSVMG